ncbi:MAG: hypothetical protein WCP69_08920 [Bacteroidota bacterium]
MELVTIFSSNIPMDCHIIMGRLECDGLDCFMFDDHFVGVYPFNAVAIGGVKLKVPSDQVELAEQTLEYIKQNMLFDELGQYDTAPALENDINRQNEIFSIKSQIRKNSDLLNIPESFKSEFLSKEEISEVIASEKEFLELSNTKFVFTMTNFWYELFDPNRSFFKYFRTKPVDYYFEKELVELSNTETIPKSQTICPNCNSDDVRYGYAIDYKWDFLYLFLAFFLFMPFPPIRKKHHCFNCKTDFK